MPLTDTFNIGEGLTITSTGGTIILKGDVFATDVAGKIFEKLKKFHERIIQDGQKEVSIDIRDLEFLNSGGIREIAEWLFTICSLPEESRYRVVFYYNPEKYYWQEVSIESIAAINPELIDKVEVSN